LYDKYKLLRFDHAGAVLTITMDNPPLNATDVDLHDELTYVFDDVARDDSCNVIVLTGAGKAFSAGADFNGMLRAQQDALLRERMMSRAPHMIHSLLGLDKPIIARVNGHAMGLGATIALFCDVVFAVEGSRIGDPHINVGLSAGDGGSIIWPHLIGYARARHHLLTGEPLTAVRAAEIGLIHKAVASEALDTEVYAYAERLANGPTMAIRATKRSINMALCAQAAAAADAHIGLELRTLSSQDHREAILALMEKRTPRFTGT
jgi:enoyl-CoA hydratase